MREGRVILCKLIMKGDGFNLGWWMFEVLPQVGEAILIDRSLPDAYRVTFLTHKPVRREDVSEHRPPYVEVAVEGYAKQEEEQPD